MRTIPFLLICLLIESAVAGKSFREVNGVISMEAENATSVTGWNSVAGKSSSALHDNGGSVSFSIEFTQPGDYWVYTLARKTNRQEIDKANDVYVTLSGQKLYAYDKTTRPDGMRCDYFEFTWESKPKGPGAHTPTEIKMKPVYAAVRSAGRYTLVFRSRSIGYELDKVVMSKVMKTPTGTGPAETVTGATQALRVSAAVSPRAAGTLRSLTLDGRIGHELRSRSGSSAATHRVQNTLRLRMSTTE